MNTPLSCKTLLITGGTGSFGNAVLERYLNTDIAEIRIFSRDEKKQDDMRHKYNNNKIKYYIGDVREYSSVDNAMKGVDYVFHAAALKQVPSCEFFPIEAVKTNVFGCENVLNSAINNGVSRMVVLSTDKAVYSINCMGMTKALSEKVMVSKARLQPSTTLCGTRYGNIMGSRGSVIPLFIDQIKAGLPITITDPNMTRYMMSLEDAIDLVMYAFTNGANGDIFVSKAPAATIGLMADVLLNIYKANNPIHVIGVRHGEKLYETLVSQEEMTVAVDEGSYYRIPADVRDLNYDKYFTEGRELKESYTSHNTHRMDFDELKDLLLKNDILK